MRKSALLLVVAFLPILAAAQTAQRMPPSSNTAGYPTTVSDGSKVLVQTMTPVDATGNPLGTAGNPLVTSGGGGGSSSCVIISTPGSYTVGSSQTPKCRPDGAFYMGGFDNFVAPAAMASTLNTAYTVTLGKSQGTVAFAVTGLTASGATLTAQYSDDNGANYYALRNIGTATVPGTTTFTTDGPISFTAAGHTQLRLIVTTAGTGNITIGSNASTPARGVNLEGAGTALTNPFFFGSNGTTGTTAPTYADFLGGRDSGGLLRGLLTSTTGVLAAPTAAVVNSTGTVTAVAASTSTTVCPATTNPVVYEVQIYGTAPVLLGLDGQTLSSITPAAGSGAYMLLPTQYTLYVGPVARTNIITAYTATAQTVVCNIVTRQ